MDRSIRIVVMVVLALGLGGCHSCGHSHGEHGHDHGDEHGHDHDDHGHAHGDEPVIGITRWSDELELFAEHPAVVVGREVSFLAHLTVLEGFQPVKEGVVVIELDGPEKVRSSEVAPLRAGIFRPVFTPKVAGTYRGRAILKDKGVDRVVDGFEVEVFADAQAAKKAVATEEDKGGIIPFLKEQQWQVPFATAFATEREVVPTVEASGEVTTPPSGRAEIGAPVQGRVAAAASGLPRPGQVVKRGQVLASIAPTPSSPEESAKATLAVAEATARLEAARTQLARAERLIADQAISQREVEDAKREVAVAEATLGAARSTAAMFSGAASGTGGGAYRISSPIDGVVTHVEATAGKSVAAGELLFRVVDLRELWITARVPEEDAAGLQSDRDASFQLSSTTEWRPIKLTGPDANASLVQVGRVVDPRSRTVDVIYSLREPAEVIRVGARVRVRLPAGEPWRGVTVPDQAVLDKDGRQVVMVQVEGESFEERTVRLGPRSGPHVGVSQGVRPQERVVVQGANILRLSVQAGQAPAHGHVH
jgi:RND family efflux transporter MFP subunit